MENNWIRTRDELPAEGVEVDTKVHYGDEIGCEQSMKRKGRLWFHPDMSMYVYYTPTHWKPILNTTNAKV